MNVQKNISELLAANSKAVAERVNKLISYGDYDYNIASDKENPLLEANEKGLLLYPNRALTTFRVQIPNHALIVLYGDWDSETYQDPEMSISFSWTDGNVAQKVFVDFYSIQYSIKGDRTDTEICLTGGAAIT